MLLRLRAFLADFHLAELLGATSESWVIVLTTFLDQRFQPKLERLRPIGYANLYFSLALAGFAMLAATRHRAVARALAGVAAISAVVPFIRHEWLALPRTWP